MKNFGEERTARERKEGQRNKRREFDSYKRKKREKVV